jgi:predicted alpha/beta-hydrolase family hydrolase
MVTDGLRLDRRDLSVPGGVARVHSFAPSAAKGWVLLGHGAGGGPGAADLQALAGDLPRNGWGVQLVEQPWRVAGRRVADAPPRLDAAWLAVVDQLDLRGRVVFGGRSAGARVACRTAAAAGAAGVLALAFPLHPPGRPERSRAAELDPGVPLCVIQGDRDPFGRPGEFPAGTAVRVIAGADHSFACSAGGPLTAAEARALLVRHALTWLNRI